MRSRHPEYNTVDARLWYYEAFREYPAATGDQAFLGELFPVLHNIVAWHLNGTRLNIHCDLQDGLIYAGEPGVQFTWMDTKVDNWVDTTCLGFDRFWNPERGFCIDVIGGDPPFAPVRR